MDGVVRADVRSNQFDILKLMPYCPTDGKFM